MRLPELLDELSLAKLPADDSYRRSIKKYTKVDVLVLDEWLLTDLTLEDARCWHLKLGNDTIGEVILERIIYVSYLILIDEEISMGERHGLEGSF